MTTVAAHAQRPCGVGSSYAGGVVETVDRFTATRGIRSCRETLGCVVRLFAEHATEAGMDPTETAPLPPRPQWAIDRQLAGLVGCHLRGAVDSFSPPHWDGKCPSGLIQVKDLCLPDNLRPGSHPVFFEGRLRTFQRRIGVVFAALDAPAFPGRVADGVISFRGNLAVV